MTCPSQLEPAAEHPALSGAGAQQGRFHQTLLANEEIEAHLGHVASLRPISESWVRVQAQSSLSRKTVLPSFVAGGGGGRTGEISKLNKHSPSSQLSDRK